MKDFKKLIQIYRANTQQSQNSDLVTMAKLSTTLLPRWVLEAGSWQNCHILGSHFNSRRNLRHKLEDSSFKVKMKVGSLLKTHNKKEKWSLRKESILKINLEASQLNSHCFLPASARILEISSPVT